MAGPAPTVLSVYHTGTASMASAASPGSATANLDTTVWNVTTQKLSVSNNHGRGVNLPISNLQFLGSFLVLGFILGGLRWSPWQCMFSLSFNPIGWFRKHGLIVFFDLLDFII